MTAKSAEMTTKDFAAAIGTDPKTLRKFLRDSTPTEEHPGKGGRWVLPGTKTAITAAKKSFAKWSAEQAKAQAERAAKASKDAEDALEALEDSTDADEETDQDDSTPDED
jgi:predicted YcjX-like family ATPase